MTFLFRTPTVAGPAREASRGLGLWKYFPSARVGAAVLVRGQGVEVHLVPQSRDLDAADRYYLGGHDHVITDAEAAVLLAAGYGPNLTVIVEPPPPDPDPGPDPDPDPDPQPVGALYPSGSLYPSVTLFPRGA